MMQKRFSFQQTSMHYKKLRMWQYNSDDYGNGYGINGKSNVNGINNNGIDDNANGNG